MTKDVVESTYMVGHGKPPAHSQFKPGQSGNPKGRPRGSIGFRQALVAAINERVVISENGRKIRRSKGQIAAIQIANKAAKGEYRAIELLAKHTDTLGAAEAVVAPSADTAERTFGSEEDEQVLDAFMRRFKEGSS